MYRKQVRRRRAILVFLLVVCLMLISISISEADDGPLHSVQNGVSTVLNPIGEGASRALKPGRDLINWFDETLDARGKNDDLKKQLADTRKELLATQAAAEKAGYADQLSKLVGDSDLQGYDSVDASVVYRSPSAWYSQITINRGSGDGISVDDAVVTDAGLIGRVAEVGGGSAKITLLTDGTNAVTARVNGKGPVGSVTPVVGAPGRLDFGLIEGGGNVEEGDELVTASFDVDGGLESRYPAGIPIGEVNQTIPADQEVQEQIRIEPFADFDDLNEITVLAGGGAQ